jgi:hypothetical protein
VILVHELRENGKWPRATILSSTPASACCVQIRSTTLMRDGAYYINAQRRIGKTVALCAGGEIDFLVAHIVPAAAWYVIPIAALLERKTVRLYPHLDPRREYRPFPRSLAAVVNARAMRKPRF